MTRLAYDNYEFGRDMRSIRGHQAAQAKAMQGMAAASSLNVGINAFNAVLSARTAAAQLALQQEQQRLQQAVAEQTARHEFSIWRQTPEGAAFLEWQQRAAMLIPLLRDRERSWQTAWAQAIARADASVPDQERRRFLRHPARLEQKPLKVLSIIGFVIAGFTLLWLLPSIFTLIGMLFDPGAIREECLGHGGEEAFCTSAGFALPWIMFAVQLFVPLLLLVVSLAPAVIRARLLRRARADSTVANEAAARIERWGFDPLTARGAWYPWHESDAFIGYADRLEHLAVQGPLLRPRPAQLIPLRIPAPREPSDRLPEEITKVLLAFHRENALLLS